MRKGLSRLIENDEQVRPDANIEALSQLRPAFTDSGSITAGNASPLSDGAAALILTTRANAERLNCEILAVVGPSGQVAGPDNLLHSQPSNAIKAALARSGWTTEELDFVEINEAFAAVAVNHCGNSAFLRTAAIFTAVPLHSDTRSAPREHASHCMPPWNCSVAALERLQCHSAAGRPRGRAGALPQLNQCWELSCWPAPSRDATLKPTKRPIHGEQPRPCLQA